MAELDLERLKKKLLLQRQEIFHCLQDLQKDWQDLSVRDIEFEEEAQKVELTELFNQLDEREQREIEEIDLALTKMAAATYGMCESCKKPISLERLESIPATRFCYKCAASAEEKIRVPPASV